MLCNRAQIVHFYFQMYLMNLEMILTNLLIELVNVEGLTLPSWKNIIYLEYLNEIALDFSKQNFFLSNSFSQNVNCDSVSIQCTLCLQMNFYRIEKEMSRIRAKRFERIQFKMVLMSSLQT